MRENTEIEDLNLTTRTATVLRNDGINQLADLVNMTEAELLRVPWFGHTSLNEVKEALARLGLALQGPPMKLTKPPSVYERTAIALERIADALERAIP